MWIAGVRAMYMQALHPRVMLGTWQNTVFAKPDEAWGRFTRTVEFVRVRTYGATPDVNRAATRLRKEFGLDVARAVLGHSSPVVTEVYAELDGAKAAEAMERAG